MMSMMQEGALYRVNQHIITIVKATALLGVPMLCSFVLTKWSMFRIPSLILVLCCYYLNNLYPDRVILSDREIHIKFFLKNDWIAMPYEELRLRREENHLTLVRQKGAPIRFSMKQLSVRLYTQLTEKVYPEE